MKTKTNTKAGIPRYRNLPFDHLFSGVKSR